MRKFIFLFSICILFSCNTNYSPENTKALDSDVFEELETSAEKPMSLTETLTIPKLQEYFDLVKLMKQHPEFKDDILLQLNNYSADSILKLDYPAHFTIKNIQYGEAIYQSDSTELVKLTYEIEIDKKLKTDSISATIYKYKTEIDGKEITSTKITFTE